MLVALPFPKVQIFWEGNTIWKNIPIDVGTKSAPPLLEVNIGNGLPECFYQK